MGECTSPLDYPATRILHPNYTVLGLLLHPRKCYTRLWCAISSKGAPSFATLSGESVDQATSIQVSAQEQGKERFGTSRKGWDMLLVLASLVGSLLVVRGVTMALLPSLAGPLGAVIIVVLTALGVYYHYRQQAPQSAPPPPSTG
jgi:hypothetical protein